MADSRKARGSFLPGLGMLRSIVCSMAGQKFKIVDENRALQQGCTNTLTLTHSKVLDEKSNSGGIARATLRDLGAIAIEISYFLLSSIGETHPHRVGMSLDAGPSD